MPHRTRAGSPSRTRPRHEQPARRAPGAPKDPSGCRRPSTHVTSISSSQRSPVAGRDRAADPEVPLVPEQLDARVADALRRRRPSRPATRRRRRRSGRRTPGSRGASRRRGAPRRTRERRRRPAFRRASGRAGRRPPRRAANESATSAAMAPRSRPIAAPTSEDVRLERAVVLLAAAGSTTRLDSTLSARLSSCRASSRSSWSAVRRASAVVITEFRFGSAGAARRGRWTDLRRRARPAAPAPGIRASTAASCASATSTWFSRSFDLLRDVDARRAR